MVNYLLPRSALQINTAPVMNALAGMRQQRNVNRSFEDSQSRYQQDMEFREAQANQAQAKSLREYNLRKRQFDANLKHQNDQLGLQQDRLGLQQERLGLERKRFGEESDARKQTMIWNAVQRAAGVAQSVAGERDPQRQAAMWAQFLSSHPRVAADLPRDLHGDPVMGSQFVMAKARGYQDPLQRALTEAKTKAAIAKATGKPNVTPETSSNIAGGLNRLAQVPSQYSTGDLENAIGTLQGDDNGGILTSLSRVFGSVMSSIGGVSPTEIRDRIRGDTEALAAAIKPLIRKPGEGAWTDADQARLVSVVGDLARANTPKQYMKRLQDVRQRVMSNFGVPLPEIGATGSQASPKALRSMSTEELMRRRQELTGNGQ